MCQAVNLPSWKIVAWFPQLISKLSAMETNLEMILEGEIPNKDLLPNLNKHWNEISLEEAEDCVFQGENLLESWIVVGQETVEGVEMSEAGKRKTKIMYNWEARTPSDCIMDLKTLCKELNENLSTRYKNIIPDHVVKLYNIFDLGKVISELANFKFENGKLVIKRNDRIEWEKKGLEEFNEYFEYVCQLPHVQKYVDNNSTSNLLPHNSQLVFSNFKNTIKKIVWENLGGETYEFFRTEKGDIVSEFKTSQLIQFSEINKDIFRKYFILKFSCGNVIEAFIDEELIIKLFYTNKYIYEALGQECCLALDIALATSGCEAVVEGFYSVVKSHSKSGGQSNKVLMERAVVDWAIPNPVSCPHVMLEIGNMYTKGNREYNIPKHRIPIYFDNRERASGKFKVSKVVDRLTIEPPRCPFIIFDKESDE